MNLKSLSDEQLLKLAKTESENERAITLRVICIIREVEKRRLYLDRGFASIYDYVIKGLGYEESAAHRRISAARLTAEIPEIEAKVLEGKLSLSNLAQVQTFFKREEKLNAQKLTADQKWDVLAQIENKSAREAKRTLLEISPEQVGFEESMRQLTHEHLELKIVIDEKLKKKLDRLKALLSHKIPGASYADLFSELADIALRKLDKTQSSRSPEQTSSNDRQQAQTSTSQVQSDTDKKDTRYISAALQRAVLIRDDERCTYVDPETGRRCESNFQIEIHHEKPFAKGGEHSLENLRLLCAPHNNHLAIEEYGQNKMQRYLPHLKT